jgi:hypothetical protein
MRDEDVLITEYRVTVLGEKGQYIFDWVNEESRTVEFIESESDFDDYNREVENVLNRNGVSIIKDEPQTDSMSRDNRSESKTSQSEDTDTVEPLEPVDKSNNENTIQNNERKIKNSSNTENESGKVQQNEIEETQEEETRNSSDSIDPENAETFSFIVRMRDPQNRREIIQKIRDINKNSADQLELSGPFEVTYRLTRDGIELIKVEDMGIGEEVGSL